MYVSHLITVKRVSFRLYKERLAQVEDKLEEVRAGKAGEYLNPLTELQENMKIRTQVAGKFFNHFERDDRCGIKVKNWFIVLCCIVRCAEGTKNTEY